MHGMGTFKDATHVKKQDEASIRKKSIAAGHI
jgi:hypothetical protein